MGVPGRNRQAWDENALILAGCPSGDELIGANLRRQDARIALSKVKLFFHLPKSCAKNGISHFKAN